MVHNVSYDFIFGERRFCQAPKNMKIDATILVF
jgi:hypothetical protein